MVAEGKYKHSDGNGSNPNVNEVHVIPILEGSGFIQSLLSAIEKIHSSNKSCDCFKCAYSIAQYPGGDTFRDLRWQVYTVLSSMTIFILEGQVDRLERVDDDMADESAVAELAQQYVRTHTVLGLIPKIVMRVVKAWSSTSRPTLLFPLAEAYPTQTEWKAACMQYFERWGTAFLNQFRTALIDLVVALEQWGANGSKGQHCSPHEAIEMILSVWTTALDDARPQQPDVD